MRYVMHSIVLGGLVALSTCAAQATAAPDAGAGFNPGDLSDEKRTVFELDEDSSTVKLSGRATIGSWQAISGELGGEFSPGVSPVHAQQLVEELFSALQDGMHRDEIDIELEQATDPAVSFAIPVTSLRSGNRRMERDMHEALRAEEHPHITYQLDEILEADWTLDEDGDIQFTFTILTKGRLLLAGVEKKITMPVRIEPIHDARFRVMGSLEFDMEDFDIEPPTAMFGLIKADQHVDVLFDLIAEPVVKRDEE